MESTSTSATPSTPRSKVTPPSQSHRQKVSPYFKKETPNPPYLSPKKRPKAITSDTLSNDSLEDDLFSPRTETHIDDTTYLTHGIDPVLLKDPFYAFNLRKFTRLYSILWTVKPVLIQERVKDDPWRLLLAVMLLNKTAGRHAIPIFWEIIGRWSTPESLSQADPVELEPLIKTLGLQSKRSMRMIALSIAYLADPPKPDCLHPTKAYMVDVDVKDSTKTSLNSKRKYPPTPISHLPGCGPYALDSYRIFCMGGDEWKNVMPADKELIKYLKWKWAMFEQRRWDPLHGATESMDPDALKKLIQLLFIQQ